MVSAPHPPLLSQSHHPLIPFHFIMLPVSYVYLGCSYLCYMDACNSAEHACRVFVVHMIRAASMTDEAAVYPFPDCKHG